MSPRLSTTISLSLGLAFALSSNALAQQPAAPDSVAAPSIAAPASAAAPTSKTVEPVKIKKGGKLAERRKQIREFKRRAAEERRWPRKRLPKDKLKPVPTLGNIPFPDGEVLEFSIKMFGAEAAKARFEVERKGEYGERPTVSLHARLEGSAFLNKIYPLKDSLTVRVDEGSFRPVKSDFHIEENGKVLDYHTDFFQKRFQLVSTLERRGKTRVRTFKPEGVIYDALSSMYAARRLDLKPGLAFDYYIWDGRRERLISVQVVGKERVWTPVGWFDAMKLEVSTKVTGGFIKKDMLELPAKKGFAWIGMDEARTPIKLVTPTKLGDAEALLVRRTVPGK